MAKYRSKKYYKKKYKRRYKKKYRARSSYKAIQRGTSVKCHGTEDMFAKAGTSTGGGTRLQTISFSRLNPSILIGQDNISCGYNTANTAAAQRKNWEQFAVKGLSIKWTPSTMCKAGMITVPQ